MPRKTISSQPPRNGSTAIVKTNAELARLGRGSKYRNVKTFCGKHKHDSKKEAARCAELRLDHQGGWIADLVQQPSFQLIVNGQKICAYRGDFGYLKRGQRIVEDCKGVKTPLYRLKKKLMRAIYGIEILET